MQEKSRWTPPTGPLGRLSEAAAARARELARTLDALRERALAAPAPPSFAHALARGEQVAVIAELKRRSPSKGSINEQLRAGERAAMYEAGGARALSILTEPDEFGGDVSDLAEVATRTRLPRLKKDFHVADAQVWEARALGASALLFIARALPPERLAAMVDLALRIGVEPLVEIRSEAELASALATPARLIGVNARDLETLVIDPSITGRLLPAIPADRLRVAESGMSEATDVALAARVGADAVLVGSALSAAPDPMALLRAMSGVPRHPGRAASPSGQDAAARRDQVPTAGP